MRRFQATLLVSVLCIPLFGPGDSLAQSKTPRKGEDASGIQDVGRQQVRLVANLGHSGATTCAAFSPDGRQVVTGSIDETALLWDAASGKEIRAFRGHTGYVYSVAFSPDGKQVLTGSVDETARLWDAASGKEIRAFQGTLAMYHPWPFPRTASRCSRGVDNTARLWDAASGKEIRAFQGHTFCVDSVAFSPDGKQVLTGSADKTARLWDAASGKEVRAFRAHWPCNIRGLFPGRQAGAHGEC